MIKSIAATFLATAAVVATPLLTRSCGGAPDGAGPARLEHAIRAFGYEVSMGARLRRLAKEPPGASHMPATCPARVDTVFVLVLPTAASADGGS